MSFLNGKSEQSIFEFEMMAGYHSVSAFGSSIGTFTGMSGICMAAIGGDGSTSAEGAVQRVIVFRGM